MVGTDHLEVKECKYRYLIFHVQLSIAKNLDPDLDLYSTAFRIQIRNTDRPDPGL